MPVLPLAEVPLPGEAAQTRTPARPEAAGALGRPRRVGRVGQRDGNDLGYPHGCEPAERRANPGRPDDGDIHRFARRRAR